MAVAASMTTTADICGTLIASGNAAHGSGAPLGMMLRRQAPSVGSGLASDLSSIGGSSSSSSSGRSCNRDSHCRGCCEATATSCMRRAVAGSATLAALVGCQSRRPMRRLAERARSLALPATGSPEGSGQACSSEAAADTIFALSSGRGVAGVGVVRISGPQAAYCCRCLCSGVSPPAETSELPPARRACLRALRDPRSGELLDRALVLWFPGPRSFTGEDVLELHLHGSRAVVNGVLEALACLGPRVRPADRGEFTERAFQAGKLDMTEVEGLADLLQADTRLQRLQALEQLGGALRRRCEAWSGRITSLRAQVEAAIDFADDVDGASAVAGIIPEAELLAREMSASLQLAGRQEIVRDGVAVAIVGPPNAGKSTLLNLLAQRDAAIVSPAAGTTRDIVEVRLDLDGMAVTVKDTAGLRDRPGAGEDRLDPAEEEGMRRARRAADKANVVLCVIDAAQWDQDRGFLEEARTTWGAERALLVVNKLDLVDDEASMRWPAAADCAISCRTGKDIDAFMDLLKAAVARSLAPSRDAQPSESSLPEAAPVTRLRQREHLSRCKEALEAVTSSAGTMPLEVAAEYLRAAAAELGMLAGHVDNEEVLDVLFKEFCIGK
eukprot:TRINITY_DN19819_c0_g3_i1.p1 TRINITY_DN19819_c0_g3~~TRINITY_DN19819_c0_g3_i1.p1  ORF type:complete len:613 (-),score=133.29 TRINITY_DN19819_c0_g3_i1:244-2082(-)